MSGIGPCMCGGCKRCLHDQGYLCGDDDCRWCRAALLNVDEDYPDYPEVEDLDDED